MNDKQLEKTYMLTGRLLNPAFQGRTDWILRWNKKTCRFETVDVHKLMLHMVVRSAIKSISNLEKGWRQKGIKAVQYYEDNKNQNK